MSCPYAQNIKQIRTSKLQTQNNMHVSSSITTSLFPRTMYYRLPCDWCFLFLIWHMESIEFLIKFKSWDSKSCKIMWLMFPVFRYVQYYQYMSSFVEKHIFLDDFQTFILHSKLSMYFIFFCHAWSFENVAFLYAGNND